MRLCVLVFVSLLGFAGFANADPAMPPLCLVRAEVAELYEEDSILRLKILEVRGLFSTLSCEGALPVPGEVLRTAPVWAGDLEGLGPGCVLSAGIVPKDPVAPDGSAKWKDVVAECPDEKKTFRYPLFVEGSAR
jgi:hypothetical protein